MTTAVTAAGSQIIEMNGWQAQHRGAVTKSNQLDGRCSQLWRTFGDGDLMNKLGQASPQSLTCLSFADCLSLVRYIATLESQVAQWEALNRIGPLHQWRTRLSKKERKDRCRLAQLLDEAEMFELNNHIDAGEIG